MPGAVSSGGFAGVMRALDGDVAIANDRFENLALLAPKKLTQAIAHPADRITDVRVLGWVEQIGEGLPWRGGGGGQALPSLSRRPDLSSISRGRHCSLPFCLVADGQLLLQLSQV